MLKTKSILLSILAIALISGYGKAQSDFQPWLLVDAEYSSQMDRIIIISSNPNQLHIYNPVTEDDLIVDLPLLPNCVSVGPDGLYAAVGHDAIISYVNLQTAAIESALNVSTDVFDIVLAGNGYVYAMPRRDQWERIRCVEIATNTEYDHSGYFVRAGTRIELHPGGTAIYGADNGLSPSDIEKYSIVNGAAEYLYDSPYHGDFPMGGDLWISEDGLRIFTKRGNTFRASEIQEQDMEYSGSLGEIDSIRHLSHSSASQKIFAIPQKGYFGGLEENQLFVYDESFLAFEGVIMLPDFIVGGNQFLANGRFVFANSAGTEYYVIAEADETAGLLFPYGIIRIIPSANPAPELTTINPTSRGQGATNQNIIINGMDFLDGANVSFSEAGITVNTTTFINSTQLVANIDVAADSYGPCDILIANPDNWSVTKQDIFSVNGAPGISQVTPSNFLGGTQNQNVVISGYRFLDNLVDDPNGPQLTVDFGDGITINSMEFINDREVRANINIAKSAYTDGHSVRFINGDAGVDIGGYISVTLPEDGIPPAAVNDLFASTGGAGDTVDLSWTAPGDDGDTGTSKEYIVRRNIAPITDANWDESSDVDGEPVPGIAGSPETMSVEVPYPNMIFHFAIKTQDYASNMSDISNCPSSKAAKTYLYAGWNLVSFISPISLPIESAFESIWDKLVAIWQYNQLTGQWMRYVKAAPDFLNNLTDMEFEYGYWVQVTEDCEWEFGGIAMVAPAGFAMEKPPFMLYGKLDGNSHASASRENYRVSLKIKGREISCYAIGSTPDYADYYVLEVPASELSSEVDMAQIYVNGALLGDCTANPGSMGIIRRHDINILRIVIPTNTDLLHNYPNPFNPETWIPYTLADQVHVTVKIHAVTGELIRAIDLGEKQPGVYLSKERSAYWDGCDNAGQTVASGIYFYTIQAGRYTATKKMVVAR